MSKPEEVFAFQCAAIGLVVPKREYQFLKDRKFRFDFAWPDQKIAVEVEGVTNYGKNKDGSMRLGRHQTAKGYEADCEKYNLAALEGWRVLRFTQNHVKSGHALNTVEKALQNER